jgi:NADH-quinone oxidoreductase subunit C
MSDVTIGELFSQKVRGSFPDAIEETVEFRGEHTLVIRQEFLKDVCLLLRDDEDLCCDLLEDIVADDMLPEFPRFAVNYHIFSIPKNHHIRLRVPVEDPDDGPETLAPV